jgi:hypothetical protein
VVEYFLHPTVDSINDNASCMVHGCNIFQAVELQITDTYDTVPRLLPDQRSIVNLNQEPRSSFSLEKFVKYLATMDLHNNICPLRTLVRTYALSSAWMLNSVTPILTPQNLQYDDTATGSWLAQVARASSTVHIKANTRLQGMRTVYTVRLRLWSRDDIFTVVVILFQRLYKNCSGHPCSNAALSCD